MAKGRPAGSLGLAGGDVGSLASDARMDRTLGIGLCSRDCGIPGIFLADLAAGLATEQMVGCISCDRGYFMDRMDVERVVALVLYRGPRMAGLCCSPVILAPATSDRELHTCPCPVASMGHLMGIEVQLDRLGSGTSRLGFSMAIPRRQVHPIIVGPLADPGESRIVAHLPVASPG